MSGPDDQEFLHMVRYFYDAKGDPTRYTEWDEARFRRLAPVAWHLWLEYRMTKRMLNTAMSELLS